MNYKVIALLVVCIAVVAAAGCTGLPGSFVKTSSSQEISRVATTDSGYSLTQEKAAWAGNAAPAVHRCPPLDRMERRYGD